MQEGRKLKLGIVGEVKSGKSSFLNAMLFDGKDILPKAPTPMTAALTKISYSEEPKAKIVFYDKNDWKSVVKMAQKYDEEMERLYEEYKHSVREAEKENKKIKNSSRKEEKDVRRKIMSLEEFEKMHSNRISMDYRACKEVLMLSKKNFLDVDKYLGTEKLIEGIPDDGYSYLKKFDEYVGAEGKYTSIVKYTEIQLCNKMLEGIEVVDTPGLNDPILSRSRTTKKFLVECDAVFLIGYCGQFLGAEDMSFLMSSLPNEGIKRAVLIGSKMDSAILQYPSKNNPSFKKAYLGTKKNCEEQANDNINECSISAHNRKLIEQIKESLPPECISSLAYSAALQKKDGRPLGEMEKNMINNLCKRFPDFTNDFDTLYGLSNIPDVKKKVFEETKKEKEKIIKERIEDIVQSQISKFQGLLENIAIQARSNQNDLKRYDYNQLEEKLDEFKENLDSVRLTVKNLFAKAAIEAKRKMAQLAIQVEKERENYLDIGIVQSTETKHHSDSSGILIFKKTEHWDECITNNIAEVEDVEENMRTFLTRCGQLNSDYLQELIKIDEENIKKTVMRAFDQSDKKFDENKILMPLENALLRITLPNFEMNCEPYEAMLDDDIGGVVSNGVVKNDNIYLLRRTQGKILEEMSQDIKEKFKEQGIEIERNLQNQAEVFVDDIKKQLEDNQKKLEKMLQDKRSSLEKFDIFLSSISDAKEILLGLGA